MSISKLYGIGVGPGDPKLLSLKAYTILKNVDMIVAPKSREERRSLALLTIESYIEERKENKPLIVEPLFPMTKNEEELEFYWEKAKGEVLERGEGCETIAFITLGDPSLYSTFYKFLDVFHAEVEAVEVIPGVTSFSACSALAKVPIAEGNEIVSIIPAVQEGDDNARRVIHNSDSLIFLKPKNKEAIEKMLGNKQAILGIKIGFEDQELILGNLSEIKQPAHYLSTLIVTNDDSGTEPRDSKPRDSTGLTQEEKWLYKDLTRQIIGAAMEVHRKLGSGFLEYVYEEALCHELGLREIPFERQTELDIYYKDFLIPRKYKPDLIAENKVIVEIKATVGLTEIEEAQLLNYLKATKMRVGLLLNFGTKSLEVKRRIL